MSGFLERLAESVVAALVLAGLCMVLFGGVYLWTRVPYSQQITAVVLIAIISAFVLVKAWGFGLWLFTGKGETPWR